MCGIIGIFNNENSKQLVTQGLKTLKPRGRDAYKRIMCYIGVPEEFKSKKMITLPSADVAKTKSFRFLYVKEICRNLGGRI